MEKSRKLYCYKKRDFDLIAPALLRDDLGARFISITGTAGETEEGPELHILPSGPRVLNLEFDDCTEVIGAYIPISKQQAGMIYEFLKAAEECDVYIHCLAGKSRSQAVTRFALDMWPTREYQIRHDNPPLTPNPEVLRQLRRAWYADNSEGVIWE